MTAYTVKTWDHERQKFTPQRGIKGPYSLFGLRLAIRKLRYMGFDVFWIESDEPDRHKPKTKAFQAERELF